MKTLSTLILSLTVASILYGSEHMPDFEELKRCSIQDVADDLGTSGDLPVVKSWFEKANNLPNDRTRQYLLDSIVIHDVKRNLVFLDTSFCSKVCRSASSDALKKLDMLLTELQEGKDTNDTDNRGRYYIVTARSGATVRSDPLQGTSSDATDILSSGTGLKLLQEVPVGKFEVWGEFLYILANVQKTGWIRMDLVSGVVDSRGDSR